MDEWRELQKAVPARGGRSPCAPIRPGQDVQIRSDQWRVLTTIGNSGHTVKSVLDMIGGDQIGGLRTLRDLHAAGLIELDGPADRAGGADRSQGLHAPNGAAADEDVDGADGQTAAAPPVEVDASDTVTGETFGGLAEVAMMPPPIAGDPWAPKASPSTSEDDGAA